MDITQLIKRIRKLDTGNKIKFIFFYGSAAEKKNSPLSDLDIAVYYDGTDMEQFQFQLKAAGISDSIDVKIFQRLPLTLQREVLRGELLYYIDYAFVIETAVSVMRAYNRFEKYYNYYMEKLQEEVDAA